MRVGEWYADVDRWPLAVIRLHGAELDPEPEFETFAQAIDACLDRREPCVFVMNLTGAKDWARLGPHLVDCVAAARFLPEDAGS